MENNQFMRPSGRAKKQSPAEQPETVKPQGKQIRPIPASPASPNPSLQPSSGTPYAPTVKPYLQAPHSLPGIPKLPSMQNKGNEPKPVSNFVPPTPPSNISPARPISGPTNKGIFFPPNSYPQGNVSGPNTPQSGHPNSSLANAPGYPPSPDLRTANPLWSPSAANRGGNPPLPGGPMAPYPGNSVPGMQRYPNNLQHIQAPPLPAGPSGPRLPKLPKKYRKRRIPIWARVAVGLLVLLISVAGAGLAYYQTQLAPSLNNILGKQAIHRADSQTSTAPTGRENILLLGSDTDGKGNDPNSGVPLAQTVMIITIDPQTNYVGMLSIPRDMQVTEDGYTEPKLDEVFSHGYTGHALQDKVAAGAGEMEDIIQYNFGIHIDHYAWVGLNGFVKVIDTAGGVDVDAIHPMVDDTYPNDVGNPNGSIYDYERLYIAPGPQHLDGIQALNYVRTRHSDLVGDFGRTVRQQQVIDQLKTKLATPDTVSQAPQLVQDLNGAVQTDLQLSDVIGLANLARGVDSNKIQRLTLGPPDYAEPSQGDRSTNYWPICSNIVPAIQQMFNITSPNCVSQYASNSSNIASTPPSATSAAFHTVVAPASQQDSTLHDALANNTATHSSSFNAGVHGLLDLLFATTFESFDAMQI